MIYWIKNGYFSVFSISLSRRKFSKLFPALIVSLIQCVFARSSLDPSSKCYDLLNLGSHCSRLFLQAILEGNYKLESFSIALDDPVDYGIVSEYFGVTIDFSKDRRSWVYRTANESVEVRRVQLMIYYFSFFDFQHFSEVREILFAENTTDANTHQGTCKKGNNYIGCGA